MTDTHNRFLGNRALSPETLMMGYGYDPFLSERSLKPPVCINNHVEKSAKNADNRTRNQSNGPPSRPT
jgi:hypothetical protein